MHFVCFCRCSAYIFQFQRHFQFRAKYSTPEYRVVATTTQMTAQRKGWMWGNAIRRHRPTMVLAVFTLPDQPAAMTVPFPAATKRQACHGKLPGKDRHKRQAGKGPIRKT